MPAAGEVYDGLPQGDRYFRLKCLFMDSGGGNYSANVRLAGDSWMLVDDRRKARHTSWLQITLTKSPPVLTLYEAVDNADQPLTLPEELAPRPSAQQESPHAPLRSSLVDSAGCDALPDPPQAAAPAVKALPTRRGGTPLLEVRVNLDALQGCAVSERTFELLAYQFTHRVTH